MLQKDTAAVAVLQEQVLTLQNENGRLTKELSAFDLDFFEEIEDLKFKYSSAVSRLRRYEP